MKNNGANIIDIGGVSSRPNSNEILEIEELNRVKPIIDEIYNSKLYEEIIFSLDSYRPLVLKYALDRGFKIINDITGLSNDEVCKIAGEYKSKVIIMHKQGTPKTMQNNPQYDDVIIDISEFFENRIKKANKFGIENIILDIGIGFGKTLDNNLNLIRNLEHFRKFNLPILIGASRKSMIDAIIPTPIEERLAGTLTIHLKSIENGASIIRCHDVKEHYQAIQIQKVINN
jgi:dihydropteroate synthase